MPVDPVGFWGASTASIDWCEQNYALVPWVCEAFNTVSSLTMVLAGALGLSRQLAFHLSFGKLEILFLGRVTWLVLLPENSLFRRSDVVSCARQLSGPLT